MHEYTPCRDSNWGAIVANMFARGGRRAFRGNVFFRVKCLPTYRLVIMAKKDGTFDIQLRYVTKGATMGTWRPSRNITLSRSPRINGASIN